MNCPLTPSLSPSEGERVPGGRVRGVVHGPNACEKRKGAFHEPPLSRPSATLSPPCGERAGRGVPIWFMVPMHAQKRMKLSMNRPTPGPSQEGNSSSVPRHWLPSSGGVGGGFMAPTHVQSWRCSLPMNMGPMRPKGRIPRTDSPRPQRACQPGALTYHSSR